MPRDPLHQLEVQHSRGAPSARASRWRQAESLIWYQRLTEGHAAALKKFVPALDALYAVLSASQRKKADAAFQ